MKYLLFRDLKNKSLKDYGSISFLIGIFFLPSTLLIGVLFLLPSVIIGSCLHQRSYLKDKWNYPFFIFGIIIVLNSLMQNFFLFNNYENIWDPSLSIVGLGNWLPFIWFFWGFQPYLNTTAKRKKFASILLISTFPVLMTGFTQYYLNWTGPFETLNGLIIWYQRPIIEPGGLSGLFNHQNYAGSWLNFVWPFCLALFVENRNYSFKKLVTFGFLLCVGFAAFLTYSRNAWLGLIASLSIISGKKFMTFILIFLTIISLILFTPIIPEDLQNNFRGFIPQKILLEFSKEGYEGLDSTRITILRSAINLINISPIFGIGAGSFSSAYLLETGFWKGHSHNLLLELAISYGLPATIFLIIGIISIILVSGKNLIFKNNKRNTSLIDKAFWIALVYFCFSQLFDIQYFDGKISIIAWILLGGLKQIIEEINNKKINSHL